MQGTEAWARAATRVGCVLFLSVVLVATSMAQESTTALAQGHDIVELPGMGRVIFVFLLIAGLAVAAAYGLRRYSPNLASRLTRQGPLRVIDCTTLNPGLRVHLVEAGGERILIAENRSGIALLKLRGTQQNTTNGESP